MIYAILAPLVIAFFVPTISKLKNKIHTGIFIFFVPFFIFLYFLQFVGKNFSPVVHTYHWIPSLNINFDFLLDGLSLLLDRKNTRLNSSNVAISYAVFCLIKKK